MKPVFSFILPTYNRAYVLWKAIQSVIAQKGSRWERPAGELYYKVPRSMEFIAGELPKGGTGKILKKQLRERYWKGQARAVH